MTENEKRLEDIIAHAEANGWDAHFRSHDRMHHYRQVLIELKDKFYNHLLFDHKFAEAFFGSSYPINAPADLHAAQPSEIPAWKFYLKEMAVCPDPIKFCHDYLMLKKTEKV